MAAVTGPQNDPFARLFEIAQSKFRNELSSKKFHPKVYRDILKMNSKQDLLLALDDLQRKNILRMAHLRRISPVLDRLHRYASIVNTFVQVKPDILALIWGPISVLLLWSSDMIGAHNQIIEILVTFGQVLPQFEDVDKIFVDKTRIQEFLLLLYNDMLTFYATALSLFNRPNWKALFDTIIGPQKERFTVIQNNILNHATLLRHETTFEHIRQAHAHAEKVLQEHEEIKANQLNQLFRTLEIDIRPKRYEAKLDWLRCRACDGTAKWLLRNDAFRQWLDSDTTSSKNLWLSGIPGAGKTFLAYWVIHETQKNKTAKTIYLFATYQEEDITSRMMILSLLFQLARTDTDLQTCMIHSDEEDWRSNTFSAMKLLSKAVEAAGPLYIVIDGLDEMNDLEGKIFLQQLLVVSESCSHLKICISSRENADITRLFGNQAELISVDKHNGTSINLYAKSRFDEWMLESDFTESVQREIEGLMYAVAARADGMFLYARVVIDNVKLLNYVSEIMEELSAPPDRLQEAYCRIFQRLDKLPLKQRQNARNILGWMLVSPTALTIHEMEQAVHVSKNLQHTPIGQSPMNVLKLCGPIVEVVDETPQFVHFTVKEYILDSETNCHIDALKSAYDLMNSCITLLCSEAFNPQAKKEDITRHIELGTYKLARYAVSNWFPLVKRCIGLLESSTDNDDDLAGILEDFMKLRHNEYFKPNATDTKTDLRIFQDRPQLTHLMNQMLAFVIDERKSSWVCNTNELGYSSGFTPLALYSHEEFEWIKQDPLTLSATMVLFETEYNVLTKRLYPKGDTDAQRGLESNLQRHYGKRLFKCWYFDCPRRRYGFENPEDREQHTTLHKLPFRCSFQDCHWSKIGFSSKTIFRRHMNMHKQRERPIEVLTVLPGKEELYPSLFELVANNEIEELEKIWSAAKRLIDPLVASQLVTKAAAQGNLPMLQLMIDFQPICTSQRHFYYNQFRGRDPNDPGFCVFPGGFNLADRKTSRTIIGDWILAAIQSNNEEVVQWLLEQTICWFEKSVKKFKSAHQCFGYNRVVATLMCSPSLPPLRQWQKLVHVAEMDLLPQILQQTIQQAPLEAARKHPINEAELLRLWRELWQQGKIDVYFLSLAFINVAEFSLSEPLADGLLQMGVSINFPRIRQGNEIFGDGFTALEVAVIDIGVKESKVCWKRRAKFVKFLLLEGADPTIGKKAETLAGGDGTALVQPHFGMKWDELVNWAQQKRSK